MTIPLVLLTLMACVVDEGTCDQDTALPVGEYRIFRGTEGMPELSGSRVVITEEAVTIYVEEDTGTSTITYAVGESVGSAMTDHALTCEDGTDVPAQCESDCRVGGVTSSW